MTFRQHVANTSWLEDRNATRRAAGLAMSSVDVFRSTDESVQAFASVRNAVAGSEPKDGYWHTLEIQKDSLPKEFTSAHVPVLIEVKSGSPNKYELEKETGQMHLDRVLHSAVFYPGDYGSGAGCLNI